MMRLDDTTCAILSDCAVEGCLVRLPGQLDRKTYLAVDKVLQALGGRWDRKQKGHLFDAGDPTDMLDAAILAGSVEHWRKAAQFFPTPPDVVAMMLAQAGPLDGARVLEPSAGDGAIVRHLPDSVTLHAFEKEQRHLPALLLATRRMPDSNVHIADFLDTAPDPWFDVVLMNPPFAGGQEVRHVLHAATQLRPGGRLVAIMSAGVQYRKTKVYQDFRRWLNEQGGRIHPLPPGSFGASGTNIETVLVVVG